MMNGLQTLSYWREYFNHPQGSKLGLFNASMSLGSMLGLFFVPYTGESLFIHMIFSHLAAGPYFFSTWSSHLAVLTFLPAITESAILTLVSCVVDRFGRKVGIISGCLIMLLAVGPQTGATNFGMFIAARLLLGFGDNIVLGSAPLLIAEIAHPQDRAILVTLSAASYHSGAFIASWVTYGTLQIQVCLSMQSQAACADVKTEQLVLEAPFSLAKHLQRLHSGHDVLVSGVSPLAHQPWPRGQSPPNTGALSCQRQWPR
jgi:MFS family permease